MLAVLPFLRDIATGAFEVSKSVDYNILGGGLERKKIILPGRRYLSIMDFLYETNSKTVG